MMKVAVSVLVKDCPDRKALELNDDLKDRPVSRDEAREMINRFASTIGLEWYFILVIFLGAGFVVTSLFVSPPPVSLGDYVAFFGLTAFAALCLGFLVIFHLKRISFDGTGVLIGWSWTSREHYDWDDVIGLPFVPFLPSIAVLKLSDGSWWPVSIDLKHARRLHDAIAIWKSAV